MRDEEKTKRQLIAELEDLRQRVSQRTAELAGANEALQQEIQERQQAREALRHSHEQLQTIYDGVIEGLLITDSETKRFMRANASMCQMLGYSEEELLAASIHDIHPPEELPNDLRRFQAVADGCVTINEERPTLKKDGSVFYADITGHPIIYDERPCVLALFRDVTDRRQAEKSLRQSHDELRAIYDQVVDGIIIADAETAHPVRVNSAYCRMLGYSEEEVYGISPERVHSPDVLPVVWEHLEAVKKGSVAQIDNLPFLRKDGCIVYADVVSSPIRYNERPCWISFFHDVSERRRAEEALRASEERFRSYFEQGLMGMAVSSPDRRWLEVNDRLCEILGYSRDELVGMTWTQVTHPDDVEPNVAMASRLIVGEIDHYTVDKRFIRKDGGVVDTTAFIRRFRSKDGTVDHILALIEDVTERKRAQEALQRQHRTLKHMLQSSDHERQLIAYEIHDGLAQQLAGAIMQLDTFNHLKDTKPSSAAKAFDAGMTVLHQGYFEARRLISGVRPPILDEAGVVEAIAHLVHEEGRRKEPKIEFHSKVHFDRLVPILENAIYRIAQEGLTNACNHSRSQQVWVNLLQRGKRVRIEIRDWGVGFDPKAVPKNRFGLAGIRERARLLGGKSRIHSKPGKGTSILVELPVVERDEEE